MSARMERYTYYAFISYRRTDSRWAHWLQRMLHSYKLPSRICRSYQHLPKRLTPVFMDKSDLGPGLLAESLRDQAAASKYLIVICSRETLAKPEYIDAEIRYFLESGHDVSQIIPFIVDDCARPEVECFPPLLQELNEKYGVLGVNIHERGERLAFLKVVAKMHGLKVTELESAEDRRRRRNRLIAALCTLVLLAAASFGAYTWWDLNVPKVGRYLDYTTVYGVPAGITPLTKDETASMAAYYEITWYKGEDRYELRHLNSAGRLVAEDSLQHHDGAAMAAYDVSDDGKLTVTQYDVNEQAVLTMEYNVSRNTVDLRRPGNGATGEYDSSAFAASSAMTFLKDNSDSLTASHSGVMRYLIDYDEHGYIVELRFAGDTTNTAASDADGVWGFRYAHDEPGRVTRLEYLTFSGARGKNAEHREEYAPLGNARGVAGMTFTYEGEEWMQITCFDVNGEPVLNEESWMIRREYYDEHHRPYRVEYLDQQGKLMLMGEWYACAERTYTPEGFHETICYYDENMEPTLNKEFYAQIRYTYDEQGYAVRREYYGTDGELTLNYSGFAVSESRYENGNWVYVDYRGTDGELSDQNYLGAASIVMEYNDDHQKTREAYYGMNGKPAYCEYGFSTMTWERTNGVVVSICYLDETGDPIKQGEACQRINYDKWGNLDYQECLDWQGKPYVHSSGYSYFEHQYNERGQLIRTTYGIQDEPVMLNNGDGYSQIEYRYDEAGRMTEKCYCDTLGNPVMIGDGYAMVRYTYDIYGRETSQSFLNTNGEPVMIDSGYASILYAHDSRGRVIRKTYVDADGHPAQGMDAPIIAYEYDARGNCTVERYYDADENPCANARATLLREYDARGNVVYEAYQDASGEYMPNEQGVCMKRFAYDSLGHCTQTVAYDAQGQITLTTENWAYTENTYDVMGKILSTSYFDTEHCLTVGPDGYARIDYTYNKFGKWIRADYYDADDARTEASEGHATVLITKDSHNRTVAEDYLDAEGKPVLKKGKYFRYEWIYDEQGKVVQWRQWDFHYGESLLYRNRLYSKDGWLLSVSYHDTDYKPVECEDGYFRVVYSYDENGMHNRSDYFDENGDPTACLDGYTILLLSRDSQNRVYMEEYLDAEGKPALHRNKGFRSEYIYDENGEVVQWHFWYFHTEGDTLFYEDRLYGAGQLLSTSYYDTAFQPAEISAGYSKVVYAYDENGEVICEEYYDVDGQQIQLTAVP